MAYIHLRRVVKHKFHAKPTDYNGHKYHSQKEANYAAKLDLLVKAGVVLFYLEQVPFRLPGNTKYVVDFAVFYADDRVDFVDVKGLKTPSYIMKKKQVEELYPIFITEV
jgi:hypothetical protein